MRQLRTVITYPQKEIKEHLRKLRSELANFKRLGDLEHAKRWTGAIAMLEDMHKRGGRKEVWIDA